MSKFIDMFAGCGGLSLGLEQAGFTLVFASDIDPICSETYIVNRNLDRQQMFVGDIADLNRQYDKFSDYFIDIDLVCGGPPCQGFSMANRQRLIDDPRNILYKQYLMFLQKVKPKFFIMENVKGMLNKIQEILDDIKIILGVEYDVDFSVFNAKYFGVPQNRERLIVIGISIGISSKDLIDSLIDRQNAYVFTLRDAISDLPELKPNRIKNSSKIENDEVGFSCVEYQYKLT